MQRPPSRRIGFITFPEITALDFVGPMEAFGAAIADSGSERFKCYELVVIGISGKPFVSESGLSITPHCTLDQAPALDTVLIPGGRGLREPNTNASVVEWLLSRSKSIRRVASVCTGIYGLAPTGLIDGRHVTTHWAFVQDVAQKFPKLKLDANSLFLKTASSIHLPASLPASICLWRSSRKTLARAWRCPWRAS